MTIPADGHSNNKSVTDGNGTVASHLEAHYGVDDSFEWSGGSMDAKYLMAGLGAGDNSEYNQAAEPFSNPTIYDITFFGSGEPGFDEAISPGLFPHRGARGSFGNIALYSSCIAINDAVKQGQAGAGNVTMDGIVCWKNKLGGTPADTLAGNIPSATYNLPYAQGQKGNGAGKNFLVTKPLFAGPVEYSDPDFAVLFGSPLFRAGAVQAPDDGFFDQTVKFMGGIGGENWTEEWTSFLVETDIRR